MSYHYDLLHLRRPLPKRTAERRTTDQTWASMRHKGTGPPYLKLGGRNRPVNGGDAA